MSKRIDAPETVFVLTVSYYSVESLYDICLGYFEAMEDLLKIYNMVRNCNFPELNRLRFSIVERPNPRITKSGCILLDSPKIYTR